MGRKTDLRRGITPKKDQVDTSLLPSRALKMGDAMRNPSPPRAELPEDLTQEEKALLWSSRNPRSQS